MTAELVAGVDVGGSGVKAWVAGTGGVVAAARRPLAVARPGPHRAEFDPASWWGQVRGCLQDAVEAAGAPPGAYLGVTACSLRQGFLLLGARGELGPGVLNSDRRGAAVLDRVAAVPDLYATTGHWPAPELTLAKLVALAAEEPQRWSATRRVLFVHDWVIWRLCGVEVTELSYACAGQLADVRRGGWAEQVLAAFPELGGLARFAPLVRAGTPVGRLAREVVDGLPAGLPVVAGCGDTQLACASAGGLAAGVVTVVAGSSTPVVATAAEVPVDDLAHPWVSTHLTEGLFAVETNAGYPGSHTGWVRALLGSGGGRVGATEPGRDSAEPGRGSAEPGLSAAAGGPVARTPGARAPSPLTVVSGAPEWSERAWAVKAPPALLGFTPATTADELVEAFQQGHAFAVRGNIEDLQRVLGTPATSVVVTGGGAVGLAGVLAEALGRPVRLAAASATAAAAGVALVTGAQVAAPATSEVAPAGAPGWELAYRRYRAAWEALRAHLPEADQ